MPIYALADMHLSFGSPEKTMEVFGDPWINYHHKIKAAWEATVSPEDVVLLPGDISWAKSPDDVIKDFNWIADLPGMKYMIRGNHDYWSSIATSRLQTLLPSSLSYLFQGTILLRPDLAVVGVRLWDTSDIVVAAECFDYPVIPKALTDQDEKIFLREFRRMERALASLPNSVEEIVVMTHYPPISSDGTPGRVSSLLEKDGRVTHVLFGHLHKVKAPIPGFGKIRGIQYHLVAADYVNFIPQAIT